MSLIRDLRPLYLCLLMSHLTLQDVRISLKSQVPKSTGDTKFTMATEDTQFSIPTENTQFSMATEDTQFSIPTENTQFSMATKSAQFSMATEDTQFSIPKKEKQLYMVTEGTQFYIPITDTISHLKTEDTQFSIPTEDKYYNLTTEDTLSNLTTEDTLSNLITEDTLSNLTTEDTLSNLTIEDTLSNLTIEDTLSNLTTEDTLSNLTTEDTLSNLTTENTFWSLTTDEGSPFDETALDGIKHLSTSVTGDVCLFKGDDLNLICSLYEPLLQNYTARDITFRFVQQIEVNRTNGINRCVPGRVINETAAMLTVRDVTFDDVGHFSCYVGDNCHNEHYSGRIVGNSDSVLVEYPPQEVTNISCVVNDWNVSMTCTWEHPVEYFDWTDVSVTSSYYIDGTKSYEPCPAQISTTACVWDYPSFRAARYYTIRVEVTNKCSNITVSSEFEIYTYEFVKPSPVENLTAEKTEPGCLELSWKHAKPRYERICTLTQQVVGESNFSVVAENFTVILTNTTFNTCGYESYTHHNFSLECYPVDPYSGFWSDPAYTDVWTRMTAPDLGPRTTNGSFTSTPCVGGWRNVTVMWQEVNMSARNGKIDGYLITLNGTVLSNVTEPEHSATVSIHCKLTELAIFAHNEGNYSLNPSVLIISPDSFSVPKTAEDTLTVEIIPNLNGKNFHLSWEVDEGTADMNFTVFWCEYQQGQTCTSEINWSEVPSPQTYYDVNISSSKDDRAYQFGISVTDIQSGMGSEIFWAKCQFTRNPTTMQNVQIRNLQVTSDHQSALVSWNKDQCFPQEYIKITNILIKWCATSICSETDHIPSANISSLDSSYLITSLNAKINYSVIVQPESYGQHGSEVTLWVNVIPLDAETSLSLEAILGGIAGGVVVVVLVVVGLLLYRNCLLRKKDINMFVGSKVLDFEKYNESGSPPPQLDTQPPSMTDYQNIATPTVASAVLANETEGMTSPLREDTVQGLAGRHLENHLNLSRSGKSPDSCIINAEIFGKSFTMNHQLEAGSDKLAEMVVTSDYLQQIFAPTSSDGAHHCDLETNVEMSTLDRNDVLLQDRQNSTSFSDESEAGLRLQLQSNGFSKFVDNHGETQNNNYLQPKDLELIEHNSASSDPESVESYFNFTIKNLPCLNNTIQSDGGIWVISELSTQSTAPDMTILPLNSIVNQGKVLLGNNHEAEVDDTGEHSSAGVVDLLGHSSLTGTEVQDNVAMATQSIPSLIEHNSRTLQVVSRAQVSQVNEFSSGQLDIVNAPFSLAFVNENLISILQTEESFSGTSSSQAEASEPCSSIEINSSNLTLGYMQLRDISSSNTDIDDHPQIYSPNYIQQGDLSSSGTEHDLPQTDTQNYIGLQLGDKSSSNTEPDLPQIYTPNYVGLQLGDLSSSNTEHDLPQIYTQNYIQQGDLLTSNTEPDSPQTDTQNYIGLQQGDLSSSNTDITNVPKTYTKKYRHLGDLPSFNIDINYLRLVNNHTPNYIGLQLGDLSSLNIDINNLPLVNNHTPNHIQLRDLSSSNTDINNLPLVNNHTLNYIHLQLGDLSSSNIDINNLPLVNNHTPNYIELGDLSTSNTDINNLPLVNNHTLNYIGLRLGDLSSSNIDINKLPIVNNHTPNYIGLQLGDLSSSNIDINNLPIVNNHTPNYIQLGDLSSSN